MSVVQSVFQTPIAEPHCGRLLTSSNKTRAAIWKGIQIAITLLPLILPFTVMIFGLEIIPGDDASQTWSLVTGFVIAAIGFVGLVQVVGRLPWDITYWRKQVREELRSRPDSLVDPDNPDAFMVELRPRSEWGLENRQSTDIGLLFADSAKGHIYFEGDRARYAIPCDAIVGIEIEEMAQEKPVLVVKYRGSGEMNLVPEMAIMPRCLVSSKPLDSSLDLEPDKLQSRIAAIWDSEPDIMAPSRGAEQAKVESVAASEVVATDSVQPVLRDRAAVVECPDPTGGSVWTPEAKRKFGWYEFFSTPPGFTKDVKASNADKYLFRHLSERFRLRPGALVDGSRPETLVVETYAPCKVYFYWDSYKVAERGLLFVDSATRQVLFESEGLRCAVPVEAIISCDTVLLNDFDRPDFVLVNLRFHDPSSSSFESAILWTARCRAHGEPIGEKHWRERAGALHGAILSLA